GPGTASGPGTRSAPGSANDSRSRSGSRPAPASDEGPAPASESGSGSGTAPGTGTGSGSAPGPGTASGPGTRSAPGSANDSRSRSGSRPAPASDEGPAPASGSGSGSPARTHPRPGSAPVQEKGLRFHDVRFRYPDTPSDSPPVLQHIDLHIRPGESMALVGATGSGKTTLTALIPRLYELTSGRITLDGADITGLSREALRARVAVAFEEPTLFSASVGDNVLMGAKDTAGHADLERALAVAQAGFVHSLPQGTDTPVGEQGLSLSGGQRQRLALARAVVAQPEFLVLDDPLSALDVHTEAAVEAALRQVLADTTALIVAHRPSTVLLADRVALLSGGRIAAVGTHHELLRTNAEYAYLMSGEEEGAR
ncbi:ATP-binding cassette domain-containing protein, partial [Streptomyces collinus]|uniref:ABC transporter ATP-binding protein n=1 Tax=Streptomyces collinus TaxID=42684 RepID=UPI003653D723